MRARDIDGILVQLPLPQQVDTKRILLAVAPEKDVDGFHPCNVGRLAIGLPGPRACTPAGILQLLKRNGIAIAGKRAVVVGRSDIVGKPVALLLLHENATVTICHSKTPDLAAVCREADILVAAIGRAAMITGDFIRPGATVIDVGMNRLDSRDDVARIFRDSPEKLAAFEKRGSVLVGDVDPHRDGGEGVGVHARARRRGSAHHRHADGEYRRIGRTPGREYVESWADGRHRLRQVVRRRGAGGLWLLCDSGGRNRPRRFSRRAAKRMRTLCANSAGDPGGG